MSSILRRLLSHNINSPRKFCSAAAVNRELLEPSSPWLMLRPSLTTGGDDSFVYNLYSPIKDKVVSFPNRGGKAEADLMRDAATQIVGSSHGWLALFSSRSRDLFLSNPLSGRRIALPPPAADLVPKYDKFGWNMKVIMSSSPNDDDCRAVVISGDRAAFCVPGRSSEWAPLGGWDWAEERKRKVDAYDIRLYADIVYSAAHKKLSGLTSAPNKKLMQLETWDISNPVQQKTVPLDRVDRPGERSLYWFIRGTFVVAGEEPDQLFLVELLHQLHNEKLPMDVTVYRIKNDGGLQLCSSLDDLVMFVGKNQSLAVKVKASQFPQLKPNSIYFSTELNPNCMYDCRRGNYIGVFDYQNKTCSPLYYPSLLQAFSSHIYIEYYPKENMGTFVREKPIHPKENVDTFVREEPIHQPQPWFTPTME